MLTAFMSTLVLHCVARYTLADAVESNPALQVHASAPATHTAVENSLQHDGLEVTVHLPRTARETPSRAVLCFDLYTSIANQCRQLCRVHTAYTTVDLYKLLRCRAGATTQIPLVNQCYVDAATKATLQLTVRHNSASSAHWPRSSTGHDEIERRMRDSIVNSTSRLAARLKPSVPILADVLAPVYQGRIMALPGVAYFMQPVFMTEACAHNMLTIVLKRHGVTEDQFCALPVVVGAHILAEFVQAFPASMPYVSDVYPDRGQLHAFESFDDILQRRSGDCEDFTKVICSLFEAVRFRGSRWTNAALQHLHAISKHYLAVGVLGTIMYKGDEVAHMHAELHPLATFTKRAALVHERTFFPWEFDLPVLVGEATSHCFRSCMTAPGGRATAQYATTPLPRGYETPCMVGGGTFYRRNAHVYTNYFMERDKGTAAATPAFFSFMADGHHYGASFTAAGSRNEIYTHPPYTAADRADMRAILAMHVPAPVLQAPRAPSTTQLIGTNAAAAAAVGGETVDFFCATPSLEQRTKFLSILKKVNEPRHIEYHTEAFCAGFAPQVRIRAYF